MIVIVLPIFVSFLLIIFELIKFKRMYYYSKKGIETSVRDFVRI